MAGEAPPTGCEYETASGLGCPNVARFKLTFCDQRAYVPISGDRVKFTGHACQGHLHKAKQIPEGFTLESVEEL